jgi:hypothetical protein
MKTGEWTIVFTAEDLPKVDGEYLIQHPYGHITLEEVKNGRFIHAFRIVAWAEIPKRLTGSLPEGILSY